jgi:hypothetical protein
LEKADANADHWRKMAERQQTLIEDKRPKGFFKRLLGQGKRMKLVSHYAPSDTVLN